MLHTSQTTCKAYVLLALFLLLTVLPASAQIIIGGSVYGGGNEGETGGNTNVTIHEGDIRRVYGGARMADIGGRTYVNIDARKSTDQTTDPAYVVIDFLYGGNDISGTIGKDPIKKTVPDEIAADKDKDGSIYFEKNNKITTQVGENVVTTEISFDSYLRFAPYTVNGEVQRYGGTDGTTRLDDRLVYIGQTFCAGNGDYTYESVDDPSTGKTTHYIKETGTGTIIATRETNTGEAGFTKPETNNSYMQILGGSMVYAFGGGNMATVKENTVVVVDNPSKVVNGVIDTRNPNADPATGELLTTERVTVGMVLNAVTTYATSDAFQIGSFFGGNNKAEMAIQPHWDLRDGLIRNLYSGGNEGDMTYEKGLLLNIEASSTIKSDNIYGGCRKADVRPKYASTGGDVDPEQIKLGVGFDGYKFPVGFSARVRVAGGDINNVYGGNDISGDVWGGSAVSITTSIRGDVYGGGNGSYAYTDNPDLRNDATWGDFYYDVNKILDPTAEPYTPVSDGSQSAEALKKFRPNAERTVIRLAGQSNKKTIIGGAVYIGGNSATLLNDRIPDAQATGELKIGSYVIADSVFIGNNGVNMIDATSPRILKRYAGTVMKTGQTSGTPYDFSKMDLTNDTTFSKYMDGCAMNVHPAITFDNATQGDPATYVDYSTFIGSLFCGGNVASVTAQGSTTLNFDRDIIIFNKLVGGCNNAYVAKTDYNAVYEGGYIGTVEERGNDFKDTDGKIKDRLIMNLSGLKIQPRRWVVKRDGNYNVLYKHNDGTVDTTKGTDGKLIYLAETCGHDLDRINEACPIDGNKAYLEWNTFDYTTGKDDHAHAINSGDILDLTNHAHDFHRRLRGGNIYGGCNESGHILGNVVINLKDDIIEKETVFDIVEVTKETEEGEDKLYGNLEYKIFQRNSGVILDEQGMDPLGMALNVFGGGYGKDAEIWGSTTVNLQRGYTFQIFGGGEKGAIGKKEVNDDGTPKKDRYGRYIYNYNPDYSTYIYLNGSKAGAPDNGVHDEDMAETEFIYGGSFEAPIAGNTHIYLNNGRIFNSFAGSCNADIEGHTETYVGLNGYPYVIDHIYGGNDLGGKIKGETGGTAGTPAAQALADCNFKERVGTTNGQDLTKVYGYDASNNPDPGVLKAGAYIEYVKGHIENIFGGCYGVYDYTDRKYKEYTYANGANIQVDEVVDSNGDITQPGSYFTKPRLGNAFVNFKPAGDVLNPTNGVARIFGAGEGQSQVIDRDVMQERSYILIDIPNDNFENLEVFGAGAFSGLGMEKPAADAKADPNSVSAVIDLFTGKIKNAFGGSFEEGITRRTVVNVPTGSDIKIERVFGGAYGLTNALPCDVIESNVNWNSSNAMISLEVSNNVGASGGIYGGNNSARRTLFSNVNINATVSLPSGYQGYVFGGGFGADTWAQHTTVNLNNGAKIYKGYGGGSAGRVLNRASVAKWKEKIEGEYPTAHAAWESANAATRGPEPLATIDLTLSGNYTENYLYSDDSGLYRYGQLADDIEAKKVKDRGNGKEKYDTNLHVFKGANVSGYLYGGGFGANAVVSGDTYVDVLGGTVSRDVYAAGESGPVMDAYGVGPYDASSNPNGFRACTNAYIKSGMVRNVYGGGWRGDVGYHEGQTLAISTADVEGLSNVVIGSLDGDGFYNGIPAIQRNAYGGGEGGSIFGTAYVTVNNGYIGYTYSTNTPTAFTPTAEDEGTKVGYYKNSDGSFETVTVSSKTPVSTSITSADDGTAGYYIEELGDWNGDNWNPTYIDAAGNVFGGGYVAHSYTDHTELAMWGGIVRNSLYGGGEIGPIGRGTQRDDVDATGAFVHEGKGVDNANVKIFVPGSTKVYLYKGKVLRDVFGGGRGVDNWGADGTKFYSQEEIAIMDLKSKGFVFGTTDVRIRGGEVGTKEGVELGYGNVFGGGNLGFVYSAEGKKYGSNAWDTDNKGLPKYGGGFYYKDVTLGNPDESGKQPLTAGTMTKDCNVVVEPWCEVIADEVITFNEYEYDTNGNIKQEVDASGFYMNKTSGTRSFAKGDFVPNDYLNQLKSLRTTEGETAWHKLSEAGAVIHNAVFAGGNVSAGSDLVRANTITVYGNATASLRDIYHHDLITIGTEHTGGLYGDGNLTFVDGFRELYIGNYGTDFYSLDQNISMEEYGRLSDREKAYFELKYKCKTAFTGTGKDGQSHSYNVGDIITQEDFNNLWAGTEGANNFEENGFCTIYAGRLLNTIQRADFVGVWGSRMVLQGALDRVPEKVDYTNYTINRVGEVSLNQIKSEATSEIHGNYFGIYNIVNFLGNLTSDVQFSDVRTTDTENPDNKPNPDDPETYYEWKLARPDKKNRNNATSANMVALASGVYLELTTEEGEGQDEKKWGYVTGIIELDLINVMQGMGGGYVYAKNEHGVPTHHNDYNKVNIIPYNDHARTYRRYTYDATQSGLVKIESSGNFVHNTKTIVDDCFPRHNAYGQAEDPETPSPAHYWYIKGFVYVYDQYISAYTGSANAYAESVTIPLTISAASHGKLQLRDVKPNLYAYKDKSGNKLGTDPNDNIIEIDALGQSYQLGDPIDYWSYRQLTDAQKAQFVPEIYTTIADCRLVPSSGSAAVTVSKGATYLPTDYTSLKSLNTTVTLIKENGDEESVDFDFVFRKGNNLSHDTGYLLTFDIDNPGVWDNYYTKKQGKSNGIRLDNTDKNVVTTEVYNAKNDGGAYTLENRSDYIEGPTYTPKTSNVYGQHDYKVGDIISKDIYDKYVEIGTSNHAYPGGQATVDECYVATAEISVTEDDGHGGTQTRLIHPGAPISATDAANYTGKVAPAFVCTSTLEISKTDDDYVYAGTLLTESDTTSIKARVAAKNTSWTPEQVTSYVNEYISKAYYCSAAGKYGGSWYNADQSYRALETWNSMSVEDRENFVYNYDGLDLLIDPTYGDWNEEDYGKKYQYDGYKKLSTDHTDPMYTGSEPINPMLYSAQQPIDYEAEFNPDAATQSALGTSHYVNGNLVYTDENGTQVTIQSGYTKRIKRPAYEDIPNEKRHYAAIPLTYTYTVIEDFTTTTGSTTHTYTAGQKVDSYVYASNPTKVRATLDKLYYVVSDAFIKGDVPYTAGQVITKDDYDNLSTDQQNNNIKQINLDGHTEGTTSVLEQNGTDNGLPKYHPLYYCFESYKVNEHGEGKNVTSLGVLTGQSETYTDATVDGVPKGILIGHTAYESLVNLQRGFIIHGSAPIETSTLYVSRESDFYDLQKEKIITAIYLYDYVESDESGTNITPQSERHIVNIHINFKTGVPEIEPITKPNTVLPGTKVGLKVPNVTPGAFLVTNSGWEIFDNQSDADSHKNGREYINNETPMYWYQNDYYVAYYAQTYLGKTYSNAVPFSVANYHDIDKVMADKDHHYYIDHEDVDRAPKIYIDNTNPEAAKSELDLLKDLFDLTLQPTEVYPVGDPNEGKVKPISGGELDGHMPVNTSTIGAAKNLEFFLKDNVSPKAYKTTWAPIGTDEHCFEGTFHGDGYTISDLNNSLFHKLCGEVYNLGVTGSFSGAGIVNTGSGYVENCWESTSSTAAKTGKPIFNDPKRTSGDPNGQLQIVNCYYMEEDDADASTKYTNHAADSPNGTPVRKPRKSFYNGEVAYNLNGFYLNKRYYDKKQTDGQSYTYFKTDANGQKEATPSTGYYPTDYAIYPFNTATPQYGYVENRFADGDFRYAGASIPESSDVREHVVGGKYKYSPIWPDDYLFFGQMLTYGHVDTRPHQDLPSRINKDGGRLPTTVSSTANNRVYRAPAYFRDSRMQVAHYNPRAVFAQTKKNDPTVEAYKYMTAIDFTGYQDNGDNNYVKGLAYRSETAWSGTKPDGVSEPLTGFFPPLLDNDGLLSLTNIDLTQNWLVYTPKATNNAADADSKTNTVVTGYLPDAAYTESNTTYRTVAEQDASTIHGHAVEKLAENKFSAPADRDHFLVDKQDFNAPIAYNIANGHRMWYQRKPSDEEFVDTLKGWQGISIPFAAEVVTTHQKGEITHFYKKAGSTAFTQGYDSGHEYWLREFKGNLQKAKDTDGNEIANTYTADFLYPAAGTGDVMYGSTNYKDKNYSNTFLWDFYYSELTRKDANQDIYQEYYKTAHDFTNYGYSTAGTPYIVGFPGQTYYEFDLSGKFLPAHTANDEKFKEESKKINRQVITFASFPGTGIAVSDQEIAAASATATHDYCTFVPNYTGKSMQDGYFQLNAAGSAYEKVNPTTPAVTDPVTGDVITPAVYPNAVPFRPYFSQVTKPSNGGNVKETRSIVFNNLNTQFGGEAEPDQGEAANEGLLVSAKRKHIYVTSAYNSEVKVTIVNAAGAVINSFSLQPGETMETQVASGVYMVNKIKIAVK